MLTSRKTVADILVTIFSFLTSIVLSLSLLVNSEPKSTADAKYLGSEGYALMDALTMGQGITTDGEYFYTSGAITTFNWGLLAKVDIDTGEILLRNNYAIPDHMRRLGSNHIGGISYYNGKIYASIEGKPYEHNFIAIYEAETLEYTGEYFALEQEYHSEGVPWVAVDAAGGYFYTGEWNHASRLNVYDLETGEFSHHLNLLGGELHRIQGCEIYENTLYASSDDGDQTLNVYQVDLETGELSLSFTRQASRSDIEAEGMTILVDEQGRLNFYVLDYDKLLSVFIRHYTLID